MSQLQLSEVVSKQKLKSPLIATLQAQVDPAFADKVVKLLLNTDSKYCLAQVEKQSHTLGILHKFLVCVCLKRLGEYYRVHQAAVTKCDVESVSITHNQNHRNSRSVSQTEKSQLAFENSVIRKNLPTSTTISDFASRSV